MFVRLSIILLLMLHNFAPHRRKKNGIGLVNTAYLISEGRAYAEIPKIFARTKRAFTITYTCTPIIFVF